MISDTLLTDSTADGPGPIVTLRGHQGKDEAIVQVSIPSVASVIIEGRVSARLPWETLQIVTTSAIVPIARVAEVRCVVSGVSGGAVNAEVFN